MSQAAWSRVSRLYKSSQNVASALHYFCMNFLAEVVSLSKQVTDLGQDILPLAKEVL